MNKDIKSHYTVNCHTLAVYLLAVQSFIMFSRHQYATVQGAAKK